MKTVRHLLLALLSLSLGYSSAQQTLPVAPPATDPSAPLPDIPTLMHEVEANQRACEERRKDYIYKSEQQFEKLDGKGGTKKQTTYLSEVFWINGVQVTRRLAVNGVPLSAAEATKENERIDKFVAKVRARQEKAAAEGKSGGPGGDFILPIAHYLSLGVFSNAHREVLNGRATIVVDYAGDPHARATMPLDDIVKDLAGTLYIDEQDKVIQHFDGHFVKSYKMGMGLLVNVGEGLNFSIRNRKLNDEAWLQESADGNGHVRAFVFMAADGNFHLRNSDYRKFKASATVLPGFTPLPDEGPPKE